MKRWIYTILLGATVAMASLPPSISHAQTLINASANMNESLFKEVNVAFTRYWKDKTGQTVTVQQNHALSTTQVARLGNGDPADLVTLAVPLDVDLLAERGLVASNWQEKYPNHAAPFTSTVVFLVRQGNPKQIRDWPDLIHWGVNIVMSNPKTSGVARWGHLAAFGAALKSPGGNEEKARRYLKRFYGNTRILEYSSGKSLKAFVNEPAGDVLVTWESEALRLMDENPGQFEVVVPSMSIVAEPPVALLEKMADKRGTRSLADAYLSFLYASDAQDVAAKYNYRPSNPDVARKYVQRFKSLKLFRVEDLHGSWSEAFKAHFSDGGIMDQVYDPFRNAS